MGLDMYLEGEKFLWTDWKKPENNLMEDGFRLSRRILQLGYWRKHPDLHGFIAKNFAEDPEVCEKVELGEDDIVKIIAAVESDELPHTEGFFFGVSDGSEKARTIEIFKKALAWMRTKDEGDQKISRDISYRASW